MRDGERLFTAVYVPKDTVADAIPILLIAHAVQRPALRRRSVPGRPRPVAAVRQGGLHLRLPGRARPLDVGGRVRQHAAAQPRQERPAGHRREHRHLRHDRLAAQARARTTTARSGMWGISYPRLLRGGGHDRRPPGAQGRLAAGAGRRLVHRRRLAPQRRLLPAARLQLHGRLRPAAARADQEVDRRASTTARRTATTSSCKLGPLANADAQLLQGRGRRSGTRSMQHGTYDDFWKARNLRPHLKNIKPAVHDRRRLVRRREPVRRPGDVQEASRPTSPGATNILVMGPWVHGGWSRGDGDDARRRVVRRQDRRVLPRADRAAVLRVPPEGQGRRSSSPRRGCSRRARTSGGSTTPGRRKNAKPQIALLPRRRPARVRAARRRQPETAFDEYVSDPAKPVPYHRQDRASAWRPST